MCFAYTVASFIIIIIIYLPSIGNEESGIEADVKKPKLFTDDNTNWLKPKNKKDLFDLASDDEEEDDLGVSIVFMQGFMFFFLSFFFCCCCNW